MKIKYTDLEKLAGHFFPHLLFQYACLSIIAILEAKFNTKIKIIED